MKLITIRKVLQCLALFAMIASVSTEVSAYGGSGGNRSFNTTINTPESRGDLKIKVVYSGGGIVGLVIMQNGQDDYYCGNPDLLSAKKSKGSTVTSERITFQAGEYITEVSGRSGDRIDSLTFKTNKNNTFGSYGASAMNGGSRFTSSSNGKKLLSINGKTGDAMDSINFVWEQ